jgi:hypothetical protein
LIEIRITSTLKLNEGYCHFADSGWLNAPLLAHILILMKKEKFHSWQNLFEGYADANIGNKNNGSNWALHKIK